MDEILVEHRQAAVIVTINRPAMRNAMSIAMLARFNMAVEQAEADPSVRAIIVCGAGGAFCSGLDIADVAIMSSSGDRRFAERGIDEDRPAQFANLRLLNKPVIAVVNGIAAGVGLGLSGTLAGVILSPASLLGIAAGPLAGWLAARSGARTATIMSAMAVAVAWTGLLFFHNSVWIVAIWTFITGFGMGAAFACVPNLIIEVAPADRTSEATALAQITRKIMSSIGAQAIAVSLATSVISPGDGGQYPDAAAYRLTYGWIAALCVLAAVLSFALPRKSQKDGSP